MKSTKLKKSLSNRKTICDHSNEEELFVQFTQLKFLISQGMEVKKYKE